MKPFNKLIAMAIALLGMVAISACQSQSDEPSNNGKIDSNFLLALARGDESIILQLNDYHVYKKKNSDDRWTETLLLGGGARSLIITEGKALRSVDLIDSTSGTSILYYPWDVYCRETGCKKWFTFAFPLEYDPDNQTVTIGTSKKNIEKAEGRELIYSEVIDQEFDGEPGVVKFVFYYVISPWENLDYTVVSTTREAKIEIVKLLREHYGDVMELKDSDFPENEFPPVLELNPVLDLAAMEDDLANGRDEWYSWRRQTYPQIYPD